MLILGNSVLEGVGTALLIPPVYILATLWFSDLTSRAWAFGVISGLGGIGAAAGPLIGGLITTAISWRAAFVFQALVVAMIVLLSRRLEDPLAGRPDASVRRVRRGPVGGRACSSSSSGSCRPARNNALLVVLARRRRRASCVAFFLYIRARERAGKEALLSTGLFRNRTSQPRARHAEHPVAAADGRLVRRLRLPAEVRGYSAIKTGVVFTAATLGVLVSSLAAERLAKRRPQRTLIVAGFVVTLAGIGLLLALVAGLVDASWRSCPGCC